MKTGKWITGRFPRNNELYLDSTGNMLSRRFLFVHNLDTPRVLYLVDEFYRYREPHTKTGWGRGHWNRCWAFNLDDKDWAWTFLPLPPEGSISREKANALTMGKGEHE